MSQELPEKQPSKQSPFLRAMLNGKTRAIVSRARVFPLIGPYRKTDPSKSKKAAKQAPSNEQPEKEWFNNYE